MLCNDWVIQICVLELGGLPLRRVERAVRGSLQVLTAKTEDPGWVRTGQDGTEDRSKC